MCFLKSDDFVNIFFANKVAVLCSVDLLCLLSCITESFQVTEGCMLSSLVLHNAWIMSSWRILTHTHQVGVAVLL